jgi:hypothetical protein
MASAQAQIALQIEGTISGLNGCFGCFAAFFAD